MGTNSFYEPAPATLTTSLTLRRLGALTEADLQGFAGDFAHSIQ
jgi:hypothetical protein